MNSTLLPPEIFAKIVFFLDGDVHTLCSCALVSRTFHSAATPLLYKRIHVSPPKTGLAWQVVEDTLGRKPFAASQLPTHSPYVQDFKLDGYLTKIRPSRQTPTPIIYRISEAVRMWNNLNTITLVPQKSSGPGLMKVIEALRDCSSLRSITVNEFAMEDDIVPHLANVTGLEDLTLINPTRAAFLILREWLKKNQDTLISIKLIGNCGSLTPGVLRMIVPCISNIRTLSIGLSYSLTNADVFACLPQLSQLQHLRLRYYRQHGILPLAPLLPALRQLTVLHTTLFSKDDAIAFAAWIRRITTSSSLESLEAISSGPSGPKLCFDGLLSHIGSKHHAQLRVIRMPAAYVRGPAIRSLLSKCGNLQHISLTIAFSTLQALPTMMSGLSGLKTIVLDVCDRPRLVLEKKDALKVMERVPQLRCITIRNVTWKGTWVPQQDGEGHVHPEFVVSLIANITQDKPLDEV